MFVYLQNVCISFACVFLYKNITTGRFSTRDAYQNTAAAATTNHVKRARKISKVQASCCARKIVQSLHTIYHRMLSALFPIWKAVSSIAWVRRIFKFPSLRCFYLRLFTINTFEFLLCSTSHIFEV